MDNRSPTRKQLLLMTQMCRTVGDAVRTNSGLSDLPLLQKHQLALTSKCCVCKVVTKGPLSSKGNFATFWILSHGPGALYKIWQINSSQTNGHHTRRRSNEGATAMSPWRLHCFISWCQTYIVAPHTTAASTWTSKYSYKILRNCVGAYRYHLNYLSHLLKQNNVFASAKWSLH
jgi:hypothetical protein